MTTTTCGVLDFTAMARATIQPIIDQPKNRLITSTDPTFVTLRENAMIVGRKYKAMTMMKPSAPMPLDVAAAEAIIRTLPTDLRRITLALFGFLTLAIYFADTSDRETEGISTRTLLRSSEEVGPPHCLVFPQMELSEGDTPAIKESDHRRQLPGEPSIGIR
ncbi:MAG: hypothetical protein WCF25_08675 [Acidimicrobiales bacterium]